jgi:hypothetical protein
MDEPVMADVDADVRYPTRVGVFEEDKVTFVQLGLPPHGSPTFALVLPPLIGGRVRE